MKFLQVYYYDVPDEMKAAVVKTVMPFAYVDIDHKDWNMEVYLTKKTKTITLSSEDIAKHKQRIKPKINVTNAISIVSALANGTKVSKERMDKRLEICKQCPKYISGSKLDSARCGICGCKLSTDANIILNLIKYEETDRYGCKYPGGSRWQESGV